MPDARGCREQAQMPRTCADAARTRGCRARWCLWNKHFFWQLQSSKSSLMMPKGPKDVQIFLDVRKPFCTKLLYTSCLMRADAAHGRGCRAHARMPRAGADAARAAVCGTSVSFQRYLTVMMPIGVQVFLCVRSYSAQSFYTSCLTRAVAARAAFCGTGVSFAVTILKDNLNRGSTVS